jgi:acetyl-CoA acyltransferase
MGESAEKMAKENGISREAQDKFALQSHTRAAAAIASGRFKDEVMTVVVPPDSTHRRDRQPRARRHDLEALAKLRPVFDRKYGTITAGNASPLTDGAAAVLLMSEEKAKSLGIKPIGSSGATRTPRPIHSTNSCRAPCSPCRRRSSAPR